MDLIKVIIEEKTALFVCAVGVPPKEAVDALHKAGVVVMNMVRFSPTFSSLLLTINLNLLTLWTLTWILDGTGMSTGWTPQARRVRARCGGRHHLRPGRRGRRTYWKRLSPAASSRTHRSQL